MSLMELMSSENNVLVFFFFNLVFIKMIVNATAPRILELVTHYMSVQGLGMQLRG